MSAPDDFSKRSNVAVDAHDKIDITLLKMALARRVAGKLRTQDWIIFFVCSVLFRWVAANMISARFKKMTLVEPPNYKPAAFSNGVANGFHCGWLKICDFRNRDRNRDAYAWDSNSRTMNTYKFIRVKGFVAQGAPTHSWRRP